MTILKSLTGNCRFYSNFHIASSSGLVILEIIYKRVRLACNELLTDDGVSSDAMNWIFWQAKEGAIFFEKIP